MTAWTALIEHLPPVLDGLSLVAAVTAGVTLLATRCRVLSRSVRGATVGIVILLGLHSLGNILEYMGVTEALDYSEILLSALFFFVVFAFSQERVTNDLKEREQQLATANQQLRADEQQLQAANQQLRAANQQLQAGEQQLRAANQQLRAHEQQLRAANRRFRETNSMLKLVLDTIPVRVFWKDRQECYLGCNRLFAQDAGLEDPDQIRGKTDFDLPWKDQADLYRHDDAEVMATGRGRVNYEEPQTMPDGRRAILQTSKVPLRDDDGSVIGVLGTYEDVTEHKRAVEALRENERRLATLMSNLPGMAYRCKNDAEWTMEFVSEGCYPLTGYTSEELIGNARLSYGELIVPEDRQAVWDGIQSALERNQPFQLVYRITTADGECKWVWEQGRGVPGPDGERAVLEGFIADITRRMRAEEALRRSEERLIAAQHMAKVGDFTWDVETGEVTWSEALFDLLGYDRTERIDYARVNADIHHPDDLDRVTEWLNDCVASGRTELTPNEYRVVRKDGQVLHVRTVGVIERKPGGGTKVFATIQDITERKRAEETVRQERDRAQKYLDVAGVILVALDADGRVTLINRRGCEILGHPTEQILGKEWFAHFLPSEDRDSTRATFAQLMAGQHAKGEYFENRVRTAAGTTRLIAWHNIILRDDHGRVIGTLSSGEDITERRQAEAERDRLMKDLQAKNEELESIIYVSSHDLRAPLVNIEGFSGELKRDIETLRGRLSQQDRPLDPDLAALLDRDLPESLRFIISGAEKMDALLSSLLRLCRLGRVPVDIQLVDAAALWPRVVDALRYQIEQAGATVRIGEALPPCRADANQLNQVFTNLLDNAIKYRHPQRPLCVRIGGRRQGDRVVYSVADNGRGIAPDHRKYIFEVFHRLEPDDAAGGEGLGLTIVKRILDRLDGTIEIESNAQGGTTFCVSLPAA